jgi:hypothetical protein
LPTEFYPIGLYRPARKKATAGRVISLNSSRSALKRLASGSTEGSELRHLHLLRSSAEHFAGRAAVGANPPVPGLHGAERSAKLGLDDPAVTKKRDLDTRVDPQFPPVRILNSRQV